MMASSIPDTHPYHGTCAAIATMHGKEQVIAPALARWFGITLQRAANIDTDALGTFTGDVARAGTMLDAARSKARLALDRTGAALGLGSEGAFGPDPHISFIPTGHEVLVLLEAASGHEIVVHRRFHTNYAHVTLGPDDHADSFLVRIGFPSHAVVVQCDHERGAIIAKGIQDRATLDHALQRAFSQSPQAFLTTDMRAHLNPTRMAAIGRTARWLALRMARCCPACQAPGFGLINVERSMPCADCHSPTRIILAEVHGCSRCDHRMRKRIRDGTMRADALKQALNEGGYDVIFVGARRDEEKSRAKERIFSVRNRFHAWDPKNQRPEFGLLFNTRLPKNHSVRASPLSNWTEFDVWCYIRAEEIPVVPLYFADTRPVVWRDQTWIMVDDDRFVLQDGEAIEQRKVRFRTLGCYPLTGAIESDAATLDAIIAELEDQRNSERAGRVIDHDPAASMEKKKRLGYF